MGDYFKPLRRKIGAITLLMACVFAAGWVRSLNNIDCVRIPFGNDTATEARSWHSSLHVQIMHHDRIKVSHEWKTISAVQNEKEEMFFFRPDDLQLHVLGIGIGTVSNRGTWIKQSVLILPYWSIVIPLTILSASLLLSKPRKRKPSAAIVGPTP